MRLITVILLSFSPFVSFAQNSYGPCTAWEKGDLRCSFNDREGRQWVRQCMSSCDNVIACMDQDPNTLTGPCTAWVKARDFTSCSNGIRFERRWVRACTV